MAGHKWLLKNNCVFLLHQSERPSKEPGTHVPNTPWLSSAAPRPCWKCNVTRHIYAWPLVIYNARWVANQQGISHLYTNGVPHSVTLKLRNPSIKCTNTYVNVFLTVHHEWIDYILVTNLMHWLLFIHKILFSSTSFEHQVLIFRRTQLYTSSIWYRHSSWWPVDTQLAAYRQATRTLIASDGTICWLCTTMSSWRWALDARNM